jgi:UBA/TS-N domain
MYVSSPLLHLFRLPKTLTSFCGKWISPVLVSKQGHGAPPASGPDTTSHGQISQQQVDDLVAMGFQRDAVITALTASNGDANQAVQLLLAGM